MKILIIEDSQSLSENILTYISKEGDICEVAFNYKEAKNKLISFDYDVIVLDLMLPDGNGLDLIKHMKNQNVETGILIVSAKDSLDDRIKGLDIGADDYLTKPFKTEDLLTTVRRVLEEAKFKACKSILDMDGTFNSLANPIRRQILQLLGGEGRRRFMDVTRELDIDDHTKVNFHLKVLKENGLISQDEQKYYSLTAEGERVTQCMSVVIDNLTS